MLDPETKRRIDTARNVLVGVVPVPSSQVEQITIALIYKFMDDMDAQSEEMGGKATFFTGEFEKFGWRKLFDPRVGGHELVGLYGEAIAQLNQNANIPQLFRDIFKNAFLPYRNPNTLKLFLKTIDEFRYDHSERLGDAFEYLLSVLGSQGDAGQFRTPRHIIDFIVDIVDPQKGETILDPASGTAGFLISAYKHIVEHNPNMTPDERKRLMTNVVGYDISPDMVRLGLANMYLHGFPTPEIHAYDTLTSEDRWNEYFDVILANPPFMTPTGGIQPHKKFAISAKRSEVLFVDYIAEHLTTKGRAGIIVPEGIIFKSQTAYKALRKMLVEQCLVAVVSLPAGVFNPYSGVKTSILILDRQLAKQSKSVGFFKVEKDGFNLGAQRHPIEHNDLPQVFADINEYFDKLRAGQPTDELQPQTGIIVPKEKLAANADCSLSDKRYREGERRAHIFPLVKIEEVCSTGSGGTPLSGTIEYYEGGTIPWLRSGEVAQGEIYHSELFITETGLKNSSAKIFPPNTVLVAMYGATAGEVGILRIESATNQAVCGITPKEQMLPEFLYLVLKCNKAALIRLAGGGAQPNISQKIIRNFEIPLPPLEVQREIVAEIEAYQKVIDGARAVIDNYRPHIPIQPDWPTTTLGELCRFIDYRGKTPEKTTSGIPLITAKNVRDGYIDPEPREYIAEADYDGWMTRGIPETGDVLITTEAPLGNVAMVPTSGKYALAQRLIALCPDRGAMLGEFLMDLLRSDRMQTAIIARQSGTTVYGIKASELKQIEIPLPPLETQRAIVSEIEAERRLVEANRELVQRMEAKIAAVLARIWGTDERKAEQTPETEASAAF
ncbi:MAG: N-6 DNA methylase [Acidobacteria bacterium]|nr:N-6 DNA methylase [Acidobacteriota bacterium]